MAAPVRSPVGIPSSESLLPGRCVFDAKDVDPGIGAIHVIRHGKPRASEVVIPKGSRAWSIMEGNHTPACPHQRGAQKVLLGCPLTCMT